MPAKDSWGGPAASEPPFVEALGALGVDVTTETYVYGDKERPTPFLSRIIRVLKTAWRFRRLLHRESFDLIHLNTAFDRKTVLRDSVSIFLMRPGRAKIFLKVHGAAGEDIPDRSIVFRPLMKYLSRHVDGLGVHTREEANELERHGFRPEKFYTVKNTIDVADKAPRGFRRKQKEGTETLELLFVSRFIKTKGLIETIEACAILRDRGVKFRLICVGDGPIRASAEALVQAKGLADHVEFTGYISEAEVFDKLLQGNMLIFPTSHREGFPNILFRAVAVGLPVVTTRARAGGEYLTEDENCLFCTPKPENIADKIQTLIGDRDLRERMSDANLAFGKLLTKEAIAEEFLEIYEKVVGEAETRGKKEQ